MFCQKMMKLVMVLLLVLSQGAWAQQSAAKSVYVELGGPGLASINFDTRFTPKEQGLGGRIGIGGFSIDGDGVIFLPLGLNYLIGKNTRNFFEVGAGATPIIGSGSFSSSDGSRFQSTFGYLNFGYRFQTAAPGFTFRAFITPIFGSFGFFPYYGGISFGYKF